MTVETLYSEVATRRTCDPEPLGPGSVRLLDRLARNLDLADLLGSLVGEVDFSARRIYNAGEVLLRIDPLVISVQDNVANRQVISQQRAVMIEGVNTDCTPNGEPASAIGNVDQAL